MHVNPEHTPPSWIKELKDSRAIYLNVYYKSHDSDEVWEAITIITEEQSARHDKIGCN